MSGHRRRLEVDRAAAGLPPRRRRASAWSTRASRRQRSASCRAAALGHGLAASTRRSGRSASPPASRRSARSSRCCSRARSRRVPGELLAQPGNPRPGRRGVPRHAYLTGLQPTRSSTLFLHRARSSRSSARVLVAGAHAPERLRRSTARRTGGRRRRMRAAAGRASPGARGVRHAGAGAARATGRRSCCCTASPTAPTPGGWSSTELARARPPRDRARPAGLRRPRRGWRPGPMLPQLDAFAAAARPRTAAEEGRRPWSSPATRWAAASRCAPAERRRSCRCAGVVPVAPAGLRPRRAWFRRHRVATRSCGRCSPRRCRAPRSCARRSARPTASSRSRGRARRRARRSSLVRLPPPAAARRVARFLELRAAAAARAAGARLRARPRSSARCCWCGATATGWSPHRGSRHLVEALGDRDDFAYELSRAAATARRSEMSPSA